MTFVCERCADGLGPEEIDAEATYPDSELGGTDPKTGGHLCKACAVLAMSAEELDAAIRAEGLDPDTEAERVREVMRDALNRYRADNPSGLSYEEEQAMRLWMQLHPPPDGKALTGGEQIATIQRAIEEVVRTVKADCAPLHRRDAEEVERLKDVLHTDRSGLAAALEEVWRTAGGWAWAAEGRGPYEWDDEEYRAEMGRMVRAVASLCQKALEDSGDRAHAECCGRGKR